MISQSRMPQPSSLQHAAFAGLSAAALTLHVEEEPMELGQPQPLRQGAAHEPGMAQSPQLCTTADIASAGRCWTVHSGVTGCACSLMMGCQAVSLSLTAAV